MEQLRDYSVAVETAADHLRKAVQILAAREPSRTLSEWRWDGAAVRGLIELALALLEPQP